TGKTALRIFMGIWSGWAQRQASPFVAVFAAVDKGGPWRTNVKSWVLLNFLKPRRGPLKDPNSRQTGWSYNGNKGTATDGCDVAASGHAFGRPCPCPINRQRPVQPVRRHFLRSKTRRLAAAASRARHIRCASLERRGWRIRPSVDDRKRDPAGGG